MAHRQQGSIFRQSIRLKDGRRWTSPNYTIMYRVGSKLKKETIGPKKREAAAVLADRLKALRDGSYREITPITFRAYAERWVEGLGNLKPSTASAYRSCLARHLVPTFGDRPLATVGVEDVNAYLAARAGTLKPKTLRNHLTLIHKLFEDARECGYLALNRLTGSRALRRPRAVRAEDERAVEVLDAEEVNRVLDAVDPPWYPLFLTAALTGMRLGELLGLQWGDVDWAAKQVRVRRTLYKGTYYTPKSRRGCRAIDVGDQLLDVLRGARQARVGAEAAPPEAPVFTTPAGQLIDPDNLRHRVWAPALTRAGLRHVVIHSLRHTYASLLIAQGESIKYVSSQLGHASAQITLDRYGHLFPNEKRTAAARLEQRLGVGLSSELVALGAQRSQTGRHGDAERRA